MDCSFTGSSVLVESRELSSRVDRFDSMESLMTRLLKDFTAIEQPFLRQGL